jgi:hypothetical protein
VLTLASGLHQNASKLDQETSHLASAAKAMTEAIKSMEGQIKSMKMPSINPRSGSATDMGPTGISFGAAP